MIRKLQIIMLLTFLTFAAYGQGRGYGAPVEDPAAIQKDGTAFWLYKHRQVKLHEPFIALDPETNVIPKAAFMGMLATGDYLPLKLTSTNSQTYYKLHKLDQSADESTRSILKHWAITEYSYFLVEGTELPDYKLVDLNGNVYDKASTKGKTLVIKCWFIRCAPCVEEMPALNELKKQYANREDVLFVSLCMDSKEALDTFLKKKTFDYAIVPDQHDFMKDDLDVLAYPTHFVVGKDGKVIIKTNDHKVMAYALAKELN